MQPSISLRRVNPTINKSLTPFTLPDRIIIPRGDLFIIAVLQTTHEVIMADNDRSSSSVIISHNDRFVSGL